MNFIARQDVSLCSLVTLTYFSKNWVTWPRDLVECTRLFGNL